MSITLTSNYRETLAPETVTLLDRFVEEGYDLAPMLVFIDEYNEFTFQDIYERYLELCSDYGCDAVDAWIKLDNASDLEGFESAYIGEYFHPRDMAEEYFENDDGVNRLDYRIVIDWAETAEYLLDHEVDRVGDFYFRCHY